MGMNCINRACLERSGDNSLANLNMYLKSIRFLHRNLYAYYIQLDNFIIIIITLD